MRRRCVIVTAVVLCAVVAIAPRDARPETSPGWPQWRGPNRDGISPQTISIWPPVKLWEVNVGYGVSSVIATKGRVYAMGHRKGVDTVFCLDHQTGKTIWEYSYASKSDQTSDVRFPGPRSTPATDGKALYTLSLEGRLHCLEAASGKLLWTKTPEQMGASEKQQYGVCCAPLLHDNVVICDVATRCVALNKATGEEIWRSDGGGGWNGAAPIIADFGGTTCLVHGAGRCLDAAAGRELWKAPYGEMSVATPVVSGDKVFLSPFHGRELRGKPCGQGCAVVQGTDRQVSVVWNNDEVHSLCSAAVLWKGRLYAADRDDLTLAGESGRKMNLKCIDFNTGEVKWTERPIPWPSLVVADGKLLIQMLHGELILAEASPEGYKEYGRAKVVTGRCWTTPALADGKLYCRNNRGDVVCLWVGEKKDGLDTAAAGKDVAADQAAVHEGKSAKPSQQPMAPAVEDSPKQTNNNWPRFRGPGGAGRPSSTDLPSFFDGKTGQGILWQTPVPLPGYSSPVVWTNRVFLTGANEAIREVYCFDADSGKMLWRKAIENVPGSTPGPAKPWNAASYAAPTPATDGRHVYAIFANGDLACLDLEGKQIWALNVGLPDNEYGHASSLVAHRNLLLVQLDQAMAEDGKSKLLALDTRTGRTVWETKRPVGAGWSSPIVISVGRREQIITCGIPWVAAYDPTTGAEIWRADCLDWGYYAVPCPIFAHGLVFSVTDGAALAAIRPDGKGDVSKTHVVWTAEDDLPSICSPVSNGDLVFLLTSDGLLTCYHTQSGKQIWQEDFSAQGRSFEASPSLVGTRLYFVDNTGVMFIVKAASRFEELGRAEMGEPCSGASPAFVRGRIYLRGQKHLYCVGPASLNSGAKGPSTSHGLMYEWPHVVCLAKLYGWPCQVE